ncbi:MAG: hypothetical protein GX126_05125 [Bacteroidales bacterium]|jgi:hypothetical protein|nr:hypothetical protein [Bacteroidales bacterium]
MKAKLFLIIPLLIVSAFSHAQVRTVLSDSRLVNERGIFNTPIPDKTINIQTAYFLM